jgi:hypothetical protein
VLAIVVIAACESTPIEDPRPVPVPFPPPVDPRVACRVDNDCEVFTSEECKSSRTVVSVNKQHREIGSVLTRPIRSRSSSAASCLRLTRAPSVIPICKRGTCARRETTYDDKEPPNANVVELDNAPGLLDRGEVLIRSLAPWAAVVSYACARSEACGGNELGCSVAGVHSADNETEACRKEIDAMPCANLMGAFFNNPPPACAKLRDKAR